MGKLNFLDKTVESLFKELNKAKFNYAIINNYKILPFVKNDIDILTNENSDKIIKNLKNIKTKNKWDYLTFCNTWVTPKLTQQSVETFNLYKKKGFRSLNIDFVRGLIFVNGTILENTNKILINKKIYNKKYFHISEEYEFLMKISGLSKEIEYNNYNQKNYKYLNDVLFKSKKKNIILFLNKNEFKLIRNALFFLKKKKYFEFCKKIKKFRNKFFLKKLIQNPFIVMFNILFRFNIKFNNLFVPFLSKSKIMKINTDKNKIYLIKKIINNFYKKKFFRNIYYIKSNYLLKREEINILNGGGVLIKFGKHLTNAINIKSHDGKHEIKNAIFDYAVRMNKIIK